MTRLVAIGGSDAGISAALCARELDPGAEVTVVVADAYPNFSICGIPYYVSGEVTHWRNLAHRTYADLEETGMKLRTDTIATAIGAEEHRLTLADGETLPYDALVLGTGAVPARPPIAGLDRLGPAEGVHLLHSMGDTFELMKTLESTPIRRAVIVGAGYIGLEMAEGLTARGLDVTQIEQLPEVLPTVDPDLGGLVHAELIRNGVDVHCGTRVEAVAPAAADAAGRLEVKASGGEGEPLSFFAGEEAGEAVGGAAEFAGIDRRDLGGGQLLLGVQFGDLRVVPARDLAGEDPHQDLAGEVQLLHPGEIESEVDAGEEPGDLRAGVAGGGLFGRERSIDGSEVDLARVQFRQSRFRRGAGVGDGDPFLDQEAVAPVRHHRPGDGGTGTGQAGRRGAGDGDLGHDPDDGDQDETKTERPLTNHGFPFRTCSHE